MSAPSARIIMEAAASKAAADQVRDALVDGAMGWDTIVDAALGTTTAVHAALLDTAPNAFPGPITQPDVPRALTATFQAGWTGGDITVYGLDARGNGVSEVIADNPGATVEGNVPFAEVTKIVKQTVGAGGKTVTIGTSDKLGLSRLPISDGLTFVKAGGVTEEPSAVDATYGTLTTTTPPDGATDFTVLYAANEA